MSVEDKILKARAQLLIEQPFFGTLALKLRLVSDESCDTAATDGKRLVYNTDFINKLTPQELRGLIAHEVLHCVFNHMTRRQDRDPARWNVACDFAINEHLLNSGFILPAGGCVDHAGEYTGMHAEAIYNMLPENTPEPLWGLVMDNGSGTVDNGSSAALEADWQVSVNQAVEIAKSKGKMPGDLKEAIKYILQPLVDWRSVLWPFFTNLCSDDYSWRKPNRAYISEDEYLPSMRNESAGTVAICIDSSGSVSDAELQQFWSEVVSVAKEVHPSKIICVVCDSKVQNIYEWQDAEMLWDEPPEVSGRGGTAFIPAFEAIDNLNEDIDALVYLTDLECDEYPEQPHYPVLWVSTKDTLAPWGETIYMRVQ